MRILVFIYYETKLFYLIILADVLWNFIFYSYTKNHHQDDILFLSLF